MNASAELALVARVGGSLLVVVVLAMLAARFARRTARRGDGVGLRVLDRTGLTRESAVAVVQVAGRGLVLGVTAQSVRVLAELTAAELAAAGAEAEGHVGPDGVRVRRVPAQATTPRSGTAPDPASGAVIDPRTWKAGLDGLRELTTRRR